LRAVSRNRRILTAFVVASLFAFAVSYGVFRAVGFVWKAAEDAPPVYSTSANVKPEGLVVVPAAGSNRLAGARPVTAGELRTVAALGSEDLWGGYVPDEGTTWVVRTLPADRTTVIARLEQGDQIHWGAYDCRPVALDASSTGCVPRVALHHVAVRNLRQQSALGLAQIGWAGTPSLVGDALFWRGPRLLTWQRDRFAPAESLLLTFAAALRSSWMLWIAIAGALLASLTVGVRLPKPVIRDVTMNIAIALWVMLTLRMLIAILNDDFLHSLAWYSPVLGAVVYTTGLFAFYAGRQRRM
jgi:hypothetical protein